MGHLLIPRPTLLILGLMGAMLACGSSSDSKTSPPPPPVLPAITRVTSLSGANEVPANTSTAMGTGSFTVDPNTLAISGTVITTGLAGTSAHIHEGAPGVAGSIAIPLTNMQGGVWTVPTGAMLSASQFDSFKAGNLYCNVHSATDPGGEIRGQITWVVKFANLQGSQEVPATTSTATGLGSLAVNPVTMAAAGGLMSTGITGTDAHVHEGAAGVDGSIIIGLNDAGGGNWTVPSNATLSAGQLTSFDGGGLYMNVHSTANPGGEIRGQLSITAPVIMTVNLAGANEVPANTSTATAWTTVAVDPVTREVRGTIVTTGITGTGAHIHEAAAGTAGPIVVPFTDAGGGVWVIDPGYTLTGYQFMSYVNGQLYVNVHSTANPAGEIRGQLSASSSSGGTGGTGGGGGGGGGGY